MQLVADILLGSGALAAAVYCLVLSRRLSRFTRLESGMGSAIAVLSAQVDDLTRALARAEQTAAESAARLESERVLAERAAQRIELLVAALHDLPGGTADPGAAARAAPAEARPAERAGGPPAPGPEAPPATLRTAAAAGDGRPADPGAEADRRPRFVRHRIARTGLEAAE